MLIKKIEHRAYLFGTSKEIGALNDSVHCVGVMEPYEKEVTDPVLADRKYHHIDVTLLADFSKVKHMTVLNSDMFEYSLDPYLRPRVKLL